MRIAIRVLGSKNWNVDHSSEDLIDRLFIIIQKGDLYLRNKAALVLAEIGRPAIPKLLIAKKNTDRNVRRAAIMALEIIRSQEKKSPYDLARDRNQAT